MSKVQSYAYGKKLHTDDKTLTLNYNSQYSCISKSCYSYGTETVFLEHIKKVFDVYFVEAVNRLAVIASNKKLLCKVF